MVLPHSGGGYADGGTVGDGDLNLQALEYSHAIYYKCNPFLTFDWRRSRERD